jgi:DNA-binding transcriptional MerR regulator
MCTLSTGEIAEQADVNIHTVRYYEERDLLPSVPRGAGGHRQFDDEHLAHLRFIKRAKELGFTLEEIRELLSLHANPESGEEVQQKTEAKIQEVEEKIRDLKRIKETLTDLAEACKHRDAENCLVLHALEGRPDD